MSRSLCVVVVAYFAAEDLDRCLETLGSAFPVVVVDNSSDNFVAATAKRHDATYLDAEENRGFAAGVNLGLTRVPRDADVALVNPDATVTADQLARLHDVLLADRRLAVVSPALVDPTGTAQRAAWPFPSPGLMWREACGLGGSAADSQDFVVGALMMMRRSALNDVGGFDETFFLYAEETDWQRRATQRGWRTTVADDVVVEHRGAGTSADAYRREALFHAGTETYIRKWFGARGWASYRAAAFAGAAIRSAVATGQRRRAARERAVLFWRGPRRAARIR